MQYSSPFKFGGTPFFVVDTKHFVTFFPEIKVQKIEETVAKSTRCFTKWTGLNANIVSCAKTTTTKPERAVTLQCCQVEQRETFNNV